LPHITVGGDIAPPSKGIARGMAGNSVAFRRTLVNAASNALAIATLRALSLSQDRHPCHDSGERRRLLLSRRRRRLGAAWRRF